MNPIFQNNRQQPQQSNPIEMLSQMISGGQNPQQILQQIMNNNPQVKGIIEQIQQSGQTPRDFVMYYAKKNNINLQPILQMMGQKGIKL